MKVFAELEKMELWSDDSGSLTKRIPVPVDLDENGKPKEGTKYVSLYLSQWKNDKRGTISTTIGLGKTGKKVYFAARLDMLGQVWCTIPQTKEQAQVRDKKGFMPLYIPGEGAVPYYHTVEDNQGKIDLVFTSVYSMHNNIVYISVEVSLGGTGYAIMVGASGSELGITQVTTPYKAGIRKEVETVELV